MISVNSKAGSSTGEEGVASLTGTVPAIIARLNQDAMPAGPPAPRPWPAVQTWALVCAVYVAGTCVFLWPLPTSLGTHIWGDRFDAWTTLWLIDHLAQGLATGTLTAETDQILFPIGYNLWSFGHAALQGIGAVMVALGVPLVLSYNLLLIGALATTGLAAHGLGRALGGSHAAGFVAGSVMATSPYLYGEGAAGCIELCAAGLLPLFAWSLVRLTRRPDWRRGLQAALALAIVGPFNWYYTLFAGMFGLGFVAWMAITDRKRPALFGLAAMAFAGCLNAPLIPLVRRETPSRPVISPEAFAQRDIWQRAKEVADVRAPLEALTEDRLIELDALQVLQNSTRLPALLVADFPVNPLDSTPGRLAFVVGLVGLAAAPRRTAGWIGIAGAATLLTLGPFLTIDGTPPLPAWSAESPLPYFYAYHWVPFFSKAYRPYRIGVIALMCLSAAGAAGLGALTERLPRRAPALLAGAVCLIGFSQPLWAGSAANPTPPARRPLANAAIPPIYAKLSQLPTGGVIEIPLAYQPFSVPNARFQYNQVEHGQPLLNCNQLIRRTDLALFRDYVLQNAFLSLLLDLGRSPPPYAFTGADLQALKQDGFRYVVFHPRVQADAVQLAGDIGPADLIGLPALDMLRWTLGTPVIADPDAWVFALPDDPAVERTWRLDADSYLDLDHPLDAQRLGLTAVLKPDQRTVLYEGTGTALSLWARVDAPGAALAVATQDGGEPLLTPLPEDPGHWVRFEVALPGDAQVALVGVGPETAAVAFTRLQVSR
jgi:hypothetical protein